MTSTMNVSPERTSEGAFAIEYEGATSGVAVGVAVGATVGVGVAVGVGVGVGAANAPPAWVIALAKASAIASFCRSVKFTSVRFV